MKVAHYPDVELPPRSRPAVTLGNFDGVHLGHQRAMSLLRERAAALASPSVVVTFEPHPVSVLRPEQAPGRILTPELKREVIASLGIDLLLIIPFTEEFSQIEPDDFVRRVLLDALGAGELVLGGNFRFGRGRAGDLDSLRELGQRHGFLVRQVEAASHDGAVISSSRIRAALADGGADEAATMLGRPYLLPGRIVHGDGRGRGLGFPTANVRVEGDVLLGHGVYVTEARVGGRIERGMTHIGSRPTFGVDAVTVETHLFDFDRDIYDEEVRLYFHRRIRGTVKFDSVEALEARLRADRDEARAFFDEPGRNLVG